MRGLLAGGGEDMSCALKVATGGSVVVLTVVLAVWLGRVPQPPAVKAPTTIPRAGVTLKLGIIPERDIFEQRRRFKLLADYLGEKLDRPVELVTLSAYRNVLRDFQEKQIDAAFLGSLVTVLAVDRLHARVLLKSELPGGVSGYRGVIFVRQDSPVKDIKDLAGKSIALVRTTMAGHLFPMCELDACGLLGGEKDPRLVWVGTHDDAIRAVMQGEVDAGAAKDLRLEEMERSGEARGLRTVRISQRVPENALVVRQDLSETVGPKVADVLLAMPEDPRGRAVLQRLGIVRFMPCSIDQYSAIFQMVNACRADWPKLQIEGPAPTIGDRGAANALR